MIRTCPDCQKPVRFKQIIGFMHVCLTDCEKAGRHLDLVLKHVGPFWRRRNRTECLVCGASAPGDRRVN